MSDTLNFAIFLITKSALRDMPSKSAIIPILPEVIPSTNKYCDVDLNPRKDCCKEDYVN